MTALIALVDELLRFVEDTIGTDNAFMRSWLRRYEQQRAERQSAAAQEG